MIIDELWFSNLCVAKTNDKSAFYNKLDNVTRKVKQYVRMFGTNQNLKLMKRMKYSRPLSF